MITGSCGADGSVVRAAPARRSRCSTPEQNAQVVHALRQVVDGRHRHRRPAPDAPAAGKTGTTQDNRDAWFIGFLPNGITAVGVDGLRAADTDGDGVVDEPGS